MSMKAPSDHWEPDDYVMVQGGQEDIPDDENGSDEIHLPINTMDNEVFVIDTVDGYMTDQRLDGGDKRTDQFAISTYGDPDAIATEGPNSLEAGFNGESVLWLYANYMYIDAANGLVSSEIFDPLKGDGKVVYPYGHLYSNWENLSDSTGQDSMGFGYSIGGHVEEVSNETLTRLLREVPDPRSL